MTRVKICGITNAADARVAVDAGADAIGVVLAPSKRRVPLAAAIEIVRVVPAFVARVAVLANPTLEEALSAATSGAFTHLQLHGEERPDFCLSLPLPVIKAFRLTAPEELERVTEFAAELPGVGLLADGPAGGSGQRCDWELAAWLATRHALVLAGGLSPENVAEAVSTVKPWAVDVSGGVEGTTPGRKDAKKVREFVAAAKGR